MKSKSNPTILDEHGNYAINDYIKRSISVRISTSGYGRIRSASRRLNVGESDVFRYLLKSGLPEIKAFYQRDSSVAEILNAIVARSAALVRHLELDADDLDKVINRNAEVQAAKVDHEDLALIAIAALSEPLLVCRLEESLARPIEHGALRAEFKSYLGQKYGPCRDPETVT